MHQLVKGQIVVFSYNGIILIHKKYVYFNIYNNVDESKNIMLSEKDKHKSL